MAGPARRPARVSIPATEQEFRERAERALDSSIDAIIRQHFTQRPPAAELQLLSRVATRLGAQELDGRVMQAFREEWDSAHPQGPVSLIDRYYRITGSTDWLLTPTGTVGFNRAALARDVRAYFSSARDSVARSVSELARPDQRYRYLSLEFSRMDANLMVLLQQQLAQQFQSNDIRLPVAVSYARTSTDLPEEIQRTIGLNVPLILFATMRSA